MDIKQFEGQNLNDLEMMKNEFLRLPIDFTVDYILQEIGLSKDFHIQIFLLIYFNSFILNTLRDLYHRVLSSLLVKETLSIRH
jgi:hypothetical protein